MHARHGTPHSVARYGNSLMTRCSLADYMRRNWRKDLPLYAMLAVPFLYFAVFCYGPMFGLVISFQDFKIGSEFFGSSVKWVGMRWFLDFFKSPFFFRVLRNTVLISLYNLVFVFPLPILLAIMFNEIKSHALKGFVQTVSYVPYFVSVTIVVGMMTNFLSLNGGIINEFIRILGGEPQDFMQSAAWFRRLYVISDAWQTVGFSSIVFIAAIAGISPTLYEAAFVDGSSHFKNIFLITLPSIAPTIIIMLILRLGNMLSVGYEKIILMYSPLTYETSDVISTFVYRNGITNSRFSYASAVGMFNSVVNVVILVIANRFSRRFSETSLW